MDKKCIPIKLLKLLKNETDYDNHITQIKLGEKLECERKTIKAAIDMLIQEGFDIHCEKDGCYLGEREFDEGELRMLIDSVLFSKTLTREQVKKLVKGLKQLGGIGFRSRIPDIQTLPGLGYSDNKELIGVIEELAHAIEEKKKISFIYRKYGTDLKLHNGKEHCVNPFYLLAHNGHYYLMGNDERYDDVIFYRVDRITSVKILDEKVKKRSLIKNMVEPRDLPKHLAGHVYLFGGSTGKVVLETKEDMISQLVDWFGRDIVIKKTNNGEVINVVIFGCNLEAMVYWALQYGMKVKITEPKELVDKIKEAVKILKKKY